MADVEERQPVNFSGLAFAELAFRASVGSLLSYCAGLETSTALIPHYCGGHWLSLPSLQGLGRISNPGPGRVQGRTRPQDRLRTPGMRCRHSTASGLGEGQSS